MAVKTSNKKSKRAGYSAATADRHVLYQESVQNVEAEIDFVDQTFKELRGRNAVRLREDFCGTGNTSCEWVRRRRSNIAFGLDIDQPTLDWGLEHNVRKLTPSQKRRITLLNRDVREPGPDGSAMDVVLAMNFSYWLFKERTALRTYFESVRESLDPGGIFFLDFYGGWEAMKEMREKRKCEGFTYVWDQARYHPVTGDLLCHIHFQFPDGSKMKRAFSYEWRLWTLPEIRELLAESGFSNVTVYWEGDEEEENEDGLVEGNGVFEPSDTGETCEAFISYIVAER